MKEIKYKFWSYYHKKMFEVAMLELAFGENNAVYITKGNAQVPDDYFEDGVVPNYPKDGVVLQYTGLKDKNDKEIYEGYILKRHLRPINEPSYKATYEVKSLDYYILNGENDARFRPDMWGLCEIIGNIYENPELLEGNNESN